MSDMQRIAEKIAFVVQVAQQALLAQQLTAAELGEFLSYVEREHAIGWMTDPTNYRDALQKGEFENVKARVRALKTLLELPIPDELRATVEQESILQAAREKHLRVIFFAGETADDHYWDNAPSFTEFNRVMNSTRPAEDFKPVTTHSAQDEDPTKPKEDR